MRIELRGWGLRQAQRGRLGWAKSIERLAAQRHVIVFDNAGVGFSDGKVGADIAEMAGTAIHFIEELGIPQADLLGFSMGGYIAERLTLTRPDLVRYLILVGTGAGAGEGAVLQGPEVEECRC